jgi:hypothetical protein
VNANGGNGGDTIFGASVIVAKGGIAGNVGPSAAIIGPINVTTANDPAGGIGDVVIPGEDGGVPFRIAASTPVGAEGGASLFSGGRLRYPLQNSAGVNGKAYGGGGSGAVSQNLTAYAGGAGAPGAIRITEYF